MKSIRKCNTSDRELLKFTFSKDNSVSEGYLAVTSRSQDSTLGNKFGMFDSSSYARKAVEEISSKNKLKARVITWTDSINGTEYLDNNVNRTFDMLQVISSFDKNNDIMLCFGLNGPNGMCGLRGFKIITKGGYFTNYFEEIGEIIGPWKIYSSENQVGQGNSDFTGGYHSINYNDKWYPSARNISLNYYADDVEITKESGVVYCNSIKVKSEVLICSYNTFNKDNNKAREVLDYKDCWQFSGDKIFVKANFEALEKISINLHYGLQTDKFFNKVGFYYDGGYLAKYTTDNQKNDINGLPYLVYTRRNSDNLTLYCRMFSEGAMTGERTGGIKAFSQSYGLACKTYHWVYGNGNTPIFNKGDKSYYRGYFKLSKEEFSDF